MKLINKRLLLQRSISQIRGMIAIPQNIASATNMCRVLIKGNKVDPFIKEGDVVICSNLFAGRHETMDEVAKDCFFALENNIVAVVKNNKVYPIGKKVLIRRDMADDSINGILIPENRRYQSLSGEIIRMGLTREPFKTIGLNEGMRIHLKEWTENMQEVTLEDGSYGLVVHEQDLLYYYVNHNL